MSAPASPPERDALRNLLGPSCPDPAQLTSEEARMLLSLIGDAQDRQRRELDRGLEAVVGSLPRIVRAPARKIVFGGAA